MHQGLHLEHQRSGLSPLGKALEYAGCEGEGSNSKLLSREPSWTIGAACGGEGLSASHDSSAVHGGRARRGSEDEHLTGKANMRLLGREGALRSFQPSRPLQSGLSMAHCLLHSNGGPRVNILDAQGINGRLRTMRHCKATAWIGGGGAARARPGRRRRGGLALRSHGWMPLIRRRQPAWGARRHTGAWTPGTTRQTGSHSAAIQGLCKFQTMPIGSLCRPGSWQMLWCRSKLCTAML